LFSGSFKWGGGEKPRLRFASSNPCRVRLNGKFAWYGPARGPKGFFRVDDVELKAAEGDNEIEIECAGYNCASFYFQKQESFLAAEVTCGGRILLRTAASGGDAFEARKTARVRKVNRYSHARMFGEAYVLPAAPSEPLALEEFAMPRLLPRIVGRPCFALCDDFLPVSAGECPYDENAKTRSAGFADNAGTPGTDGFPKSELVRNLWHEQQRFRPAEGSAPAKADVYRVDAGRHILFEGPLNRTGFPELSVRCLKPGEIHLMFDERPVPDQFKPWRSVVANDIVWKFEKEGVYEISAFEPYVLRACRVVARGGSFEISAPRLRLYRNIDSRKAVFRSSDKALEKLFAAAEENFAQNSVDGFMDCPGRERANWNCDAFFTSRASWLLCASPLQETVFFDNFARPAHFDNIDRGMLPMCYPSDFRNGNYIPSWSMFFVLQLDEYMRLRGGDGEIREMLKPKVFELVEFFSRYRNSDGLLEKLPRWVFVEWSEANKFVQDVNYPNNMLWAAALEAVDRLYGRPDLGEEARRMKETIRRQSWTGEWFCDNAVRGGDGKLKLSGECSETCQYYAFYFGTATEELYPDLFRRLTAEFGPERVKKGLYPRIHPSAPFIGNYLRLDWLGRMGRSSQVYGEMSGYFLQMAETTGTLWENADSADNGSCCHGFASHVAVFIIRDIVGLKAIDPGKRTVVFDPPAGLSVPDCDLVLPLGEGCARFRWRRENGKAMKNIELPKGWKEAK
jgi:alpha-L-rhamnosidase